MNDTDVFPVFDSSNSATRSVSFKILRDAVPNITNVTFTDPNLMITFSDGSKSTTDISSSSGSDPTFTTLSEGQVGRADDDGKLIYSGATVDIDTGEWTFDQAINVPSGTLNVSDTLSISEATLALFIRDNVLQTNFTGVQAAISDEGSSRPFILEAPSSITIISQPDDSTLITTNPLLVPTLAAFDNETDVFTLRAQEAMTNVRLTLTDINTGVVLKYLPNKAAVNSGTGGFDFVAGDNVINLNSNAADTPGVFNVGFTPLRSRIGEAGSILVEADSVALLGTPSGVPYVSNELHPLFNTIIAREFETSNIADNFVRLNNAYTSTTGTPSGMLGTYAADATADTVTAGQFTAGVAATSNPTVITVGSDTFSQNDLVQITGSVLNSGIYEVEDHTGATLTVRGVGTVDKVEAFSRTNFISDVSNATITKINVSIVRFSDSGALQSGSGSESGITYSDLSNGEEHPVTLRRDMPSAEDSLALVNASLNQNSALWLVANNQLTSSNRSDATIYALQAGFLDLDGNEIPTSPVAANTIQLRGGTTVRIFGQNDFRVVTSPVLEGDITASRTDEEIRDVSYAGMVGGNGINVTVDDAANTVTISTGGGPPDAGPSSLFYGRSATDNPATVDTATLTSISATDPQTVETGTAAQGDYFIILTANTHDISTITDTVLQQDVTSIFVKTDNVRTIGAIVYDSYVIGPLNAGVNESYVLEF